MTSEAPSNRERRFLAGLRSDDAQTREAAALSLNQSSHPLILAALRSALSDSEPEVAEAAAQSLALVGDLGSLALVLDKAAESVAPWPRASLWAATALALASGEEGPLRRATQLVERAARSRVAEGRRQAHYLREMLADAGRSSP